MKEMTINGIDISVFNARLLDYSVSGTSIINNISESYGSTLKMPLLFNTEPSTRTLLITLIFFPQSFGENAKNTTIMNRLSAASENISRFESLLIGKTVEIALPDGFLYTAMIQTLPAAAFDSSGEHEITYSFIAVRHRPTISKTIKSGNSVFCESTTATSCIIQANFDEITASGSGGSKIILFGIRVNNLVPPVQIIIDGVNGMITANGVNKFADTNLIDFPMLNPGNNVIDCTEDDVDITITYTPIYI